MRKRRRLADKLTIMVCAVLVAFSAFFYAPMDVEAQSDVKSVSGSIDNFTFNQFPNTFFTHSIGCDLLDSSFSNDLYYSVHYKFDYSFLFNYSLKSLRNFVLSYYKSGNVVNLYSSPFFNENSSSYSGSFEFNIVVKGSDLKYGLLCTDFRLFSSSDSNDNLSCDYSFDYSILEYSVLTGEESASYQQGYNAGYSAGEQVGESNGYSNGYSDGFEAGEQSGYDSGYDAGVQDGFQSGQGSVDTQSYYDAGYNAGYDTGYLEGYDEGYNLGYDEGFSAGEAVGYEKGYESGWQAFKDKISGWGADTTEYPLLISSSSEPFDLDFHFLEATTDNFVYSDYEEFEVFLNDVNFNPNHTYKLVFTYHDFRWRTTLFFTSSFSCWLYWGSSSFPLVLDSVGNDITSSFYITGDRIGNNLRFLFELGQIESSGTTESLDYFLDGCTFELYDMGPSGDTQNHIANQTDQLTGGYNDSQGNSVNNDFSSGLNEFETAEDSLFATATTGMKDFTFFDISSVPAMVTGMSFVGSIMSGWFTQAGGASGVGIVLSILFSIMLVAMVLGLYRWYQSKGGKD